ncbi:MAG: V-type ATP synthase subunit E family protein [Pleomorphochaeta sp.]|nr:V-type ATP synthase subunit E family protein [Sphaerochaetaceae bacterium]
MDTDNKLLKGIGLEAEGKAKKIIADAEKRVESIYLQNEHKIEKELSKEDKDFENRVQIENLKVKSAKKATERKAELSILEKKYNYLFSSIKKKIYSNIEGKDGQPLLEKWILEAVLGLGLSEAKIAFSSNCPVDDKMLANVVETAKNDYNLDLHLQLDSRRLIDSGIVATSLDGKVSFNNQVEIRMRRFDREIKKAVQEGLCP